MQNKVAGFKRRYGTPTSQTAPMLASKASERDIGAMANGLAERVPGDDGTQRLALYGVVGIMLTAIAGVVGMYYELW